MSLTPGFILADGMNSCVGVTLPEIAAIVAEWDAGQALPRDERRSRRPFSVEGSPARLRIGWDRWADAPVLSVHRGSGDHADVEAPQIAEMRRVLAGQVAP